MYITEVPGEGGFFKHGVFLRPEFYGSLDTKVYPRLPVHGTMLTIGFPKVFYKSFIQCIIKYVVTKSYLQLN